MEVEKRERKKGRGVKGGIRNWQGRFAPLLPGDIDANWERNRGGEGGNYHLNPLLKVNPRTNETLDK
jgi:hypothetical protein